VEGDNRINREDGTCGRVQARTGHGSSEHHRRRVGQTRERAGEKKKKAKGKPVKIERKVTGGGGVANKRKRPVQPANVASGIERECGGAKKGL